MENRHTVLGSFWHESINNNSGDWSNQSTRGLPFCLFSFFSLIIIVGGDVSHLGMIVVRSTVLVMIGSGFQGK